MTVDHDIFRCLVLVAQSTRLRFLYSAIIVKVAFKLITFVAANPPTCHFVANRAISDYVLNYYFNITDNFF